MKTVTVTYDDKISRYFVFASVAWGIIGMLVGAIVALQLAFVDANVGPWFSFGRLRPLHTNAVIFAFVGNMIFAGIYYSTQRLLKTRLASDKLSWIHFWGWQGIIVSAVITLPLGITQSKEYAELEWPIDIAIAVIWLVFAFNFFWTLKKRNEKQLYVAIWFYIATIIAITVLHVVNGLAIPVSMTQSYSLFGGVQDALVQWWYGHNAVAFFLTTPVLGIMYYFLPKAVDRPVFSYRLSIVHFWGLVFLYIWAGPHHLLYTALPEWAQTLGMIFSLMLWATSWGGMINGLLTLRGAWDKLRTDPVLKFFAAGVTFYGMATFEGPLLSIKSVSGLAHYTDWIIAHVHGGALGWNGFMAAGMFYWMIPKIYGKKLFSTEAANLHFYLGTFGILLYIGSMWAAGIMQGLMWRAPGPDGGLLYTFIETVVVLEPLYWARLIGGTLYLVGFCILAWNLWATARGTKPLVVSIEVPVREPADASPYRSGGTVSAPAAEPHWARLVFAKPVIFSLVLLALFGLADYVNPMAGIFLVVISLGILLFGSLALSFGSKDGNPTWHSMLEGRALPFTILTVVAVLIGGVAEIIPLVVTGQEDLRTTSNVPYSALELEGRDIYISEGCYTCHSQMIRPFLWETDRYGAVSTADESIFDHPFQWGSKRTGPDLAREGGLRSDDWHYNHMLDPRSVTHGSIMPSYPHLADETVDLSRTSDKLRALRNIGVPYSPEVIQAAEATARRDGERIAGNLRDTLTVELAPNTKMVALIAYLQRLGRIPAPVSEAEVTQLELSEEQ